ncbi:hypothetical protein [Luteitalea sp.]|jgi:hypothetical protein
MPPTATPAIDLPATSDPQLWTRFARLMAAAAVVGAILGGVG